MSIRCGTCKGRHDTVAQVLECSAAKAERSECKHGLATGTCILCASWVRRLGRSKNRRIGTATTRARKPLNAPEWITELDPDATGLCSICGEPIYVGERISVRAGRRDWAHTDCFVDPANAAPQNELVSQREPDPEYNDAYSRIAALERLADALLPEAVAIEQETTILLLKQVAEDMSYDLSIDLIRETIYGYSLEMLGAFEPRDESDYLMLEDEERYLYMLLQAYAEL